LSIAVGVRIPSLLFRVPPFAFPGYRCYPRLSGHDPLEQEPALAQVAGAFLVEPAWAAKVEKALSVLPDPHFWHLCEPFAPAFSRKLVTCPHWRHLYSNIGIRSLLVIDEAFILTTPPPAAKALFPALRHHERLCANGLEPSGLHGVSSGRFAWVRRGPRLGDTPLRAAWPELD
jgi:hypothetical protein